MLILLFVKSKQAICIVLSVSVTKNLKFKALYLKYIGFPKKESFRNVNDLRYFFLTYASLNNLVIINHLSFLFFWKVYAVPCVDFKIIHVLKIESYVLFNGKF